MKFIKKTVCAALLSLLLVTLLFGCSEKKRTIDVPQAPEIVELYNSNFVSDLTKYCHSGAKFVLKEDIKIDEEEWKPIGQTVSTAFNGTLDGGGFTIDGLRTVGWDTDGTPVTILKRIMGWKADGTPVYNSSKVIDMKTRENNGYTEVTDIIYEGDSDDPAYLDMVDKGIEEPKTSFGSIGLFGYTYGATIKNINFKNADFKFFGDGESVYAGIVSGYDIGSDFIDVNINDCAIKAGNLYETVINYHVENAKPSSVDYKSNTKQYLGGVVGYSRGNALVNGTDVTYKKTVLKNVTVDNIEINNTVVSAYFNAQLSAVNADETKPIESSILKTSLTDEDGFGKYDVHSMIKPVRQVFAGGVSGYSVGAEISGVTVSRFNSGRQEITGDKVTAGAVSSSVLGKESVVDGFNVSDIYFHSENVAVSAMVGGAFGEVKSATVKGNNTIKDVDACVKGALPGVQNVCVSGFAAYCDEGADLSGVSVEDCKVESNFITTGNLGSILAGLVSVLRDGKLSDSKAKNVTFNIENNEEANDDYCFTRNAVSQVYGNSSIVGIETVACKYYNENTLEEYAKVTPVVSKNNYVNEDGESSVRLFYTVGDKRSDVYVTVYGDLVPKMAGTSYRMRETTVWEALTEEQKSQLTEGQSLIGLSETYYYSHYNIDKKEWHWNVIQDVKSLPDEEKTYDSSKLYAFEKKVYLAEVPVGATIKDNTFYTYDVEKGKLSVASGTFGEGVDYYVPMETEIEKYELDVTVYTESDKTIVVRKGATEDDDVLAKATYSVPLEKFKANVTVYDDLGNEYVLCPAELYLDSYFAKGTGFLADINGFVITDASGAQNRNFASYELVTGRPSIAADAITYKSTDE